MENPSWKTQRSIISLAMISLAALYLFVKQQQPAITIWIPPGMIILGIPTVIVSSIIFGRFQNVYDYEPTQFLGQDMNGKRVRALLFNIGLAGGWFIVLGVTFSLFDYLTGK